MAWCPCFVRLGAGRSPALKISKLFALATFFNRSAPYFQTLTTDQPLSPRDAVLKQGGMPNTTRPVSQRRLAANRTNAARSTGPRTPEGKARSARNARKHGLAASNFAVVELDEVASLDQLRADAVAFYQPHNSQEVFAVERIAFAQQAFLRCAKVEAGLFSAAMNGFVAPGESDDRNPSLVLALGFERQCQTSAAWKLFLRYQTQTERQYRRAIEDFERLKELRNELPNEPITAPQPQETKADESASPPRDRSIPNPRETVIAPITPLCPPEGRAHRPRTAPESPDPANSSPSARGIIGFSPSLLS